MRGTQTNYMARAHLCQIVLFNIINSLSKTFDIGGSTWKNVRMSLSNEQKREIRKILAKSESKAAAKAPLGAVSEGQLERIVESYFAKMQAKLPMGRPPSVRGVKTRGIRLDQETEDFVTALTKEWGCNHSEAIRRIIREYGVLRKSSKSVVAAAE